MRVEDVLWDNLYCSDHGGDVSGSEVVRTSCYLEHIPVSIKSRCPHFRGLEQRSSTVYITAVLTGSGCVTTFQLLKLYVEVISRVRDPLLFILFYFVLFCLFVCLFIYLFPLQNGNNLKTDVMILYIDRCHNKHYRKHVGMLEGKNLMHSFEIE